MQLPGRGPGGGMQDEANDAGARGEAPLFRALHEIAVAIGGVLDPVELGEVVAERARQLLGADGVGMQIWDEVSERLLPLYFSDARDLGQPTPTPLGQGVSGRAAQRREPVFVEDYQDWPTAHPWARVAGIASACGVPLVAASRLVGTLVVRYYWAHPFTKADLDVLALLAALVAPSLDAARLHKALQTELGERERAQAALAASERRFRSLIEHGGDVVVLVDADGTVTYTSGSIERLTGFTADELSGQPCLQLVHPDDQGRMASVFRRLMLEPGARASVEVRCRDRRGAWRVWEAVATSHLNDPALRAIAVNARDVTERAEHQRRQEALLRLSRSLPEENDGVAVMSLLLDEAIQAASADAASVLRWDDERRDLVVVGTTFRALPTGSRVPLGAGAPGQAAQTRRPVIVNDYPRSSNPTVEGLAAGIQAAMAVPLVHEGVIFGVLSVATLSADRTFTERDLEPLELMAGLAAGTLAGLQRARLQGALLAARTAEHHLNNQLAVTVGYSELLASRGGLSDEARKMALEALRGAQRAAQTLRTLLEITQVRESDLDLPGGGILELPRPTELDERR